MGGAPRRRMTAPLERGRGGPSKSTQTKRHNYYFFCFRGVPLRESRKISLNSLPSSARNGSHHQHGTLHEIDTVLSQFFWRSTQWYNGVDCSLAFFLSYFAWLSGIFR